MKTILVVFLSVGVFLHSFAKAADLISCDQIYSQRGPVELLKSVDCYQEVLGTSTSDFQLITYERVFIALSAVVNDSPKTQFEITAIQRALELIATLEKQFPTTADLFYWRAVFVSFDAIQKDRGAMLPRHLFAVLKSLQEDLRRALAINPSIHLYGPARVLGLMHTQMPAIVGGDKVLAEKMLLQSFQQAPKASLNHLAYAKILRINGKDEAAKAVLTRFLALSDSELDPYPGEPLRGLAPELRKDRNEARAILDELNGE